MAILTNKGRGKITADHLLLALEDLADMSGVDFEILELEARALRITVSGDIDLEVLARLIEEHVNAL